MNDKTEQNAGNIRPFGMRDKIGYMFGDFGNDFTFIFCQLFSHGILYKGIGESAALLWVPLFWWQDAWMR